MSAIQSGANWWVDSMVRFPGGDVSRNFKDGAMNNTASVDTLEDTVDSLTSVISDVEEEGELPEPQEETRSAQTIHDTLAEEISAGQDDLSASEELVSAMAKHLEIIEAAMRQHQSGGASRFHDDAGDSEQDPVDAGFTGSLLDDMLQDPSATFAAIIPANDRLGLLGLLKN